MISVIVPIYDVEPYIHICLDSILNQTYQDLDIILVDDGSPDSCGQICDQYAAKDSRIRVFHTQNKGLSAARNLGIRNARGKYITLVDADDWIEKDMIEELYKNIIESDADICICGFWYDYPDSTTEFKYRSKTYTRLEGMQALLTDEICNTAWSKLYAKHLFDKVSYPEGENYEDIATTHRLFFEASRITTVPIMGYHYRKRENSITTTHSVKNLLDCANASIFMFNFFRDYTSNLFNDYEDELLRFTATRICRVWRWWYACEKAEKKKQHSSIESLCTFSKNHLKHASTKNWPKHLRFSLPFMLHTSSISFAFLYFSNQLFRKLCPTKSNLLIQ